jgi:hypothetical protein
VKFSLVFGTKTSFEERERTEIFLMDDPYSIAPYSIQELFPDPEK